jgi:hypothetical protein
LVLFALVSIELFHRFLGHPDLVGHVDIDLRLRQRFPNKRDRLVISAPLFRQTSGCGLRDIAQWAGLTRTRLSEWDQALAADGTMLQIMKTLKLDRASALSWSGGGQRSHSRDKKVAAGVTAIRFQNFREALRGSR